MWKSLLSRKRRTGTPCDQTLSDSHESTSYTNWRVQPIKPKNNQCHRESQYICRALWKSQAYTVCPAICTSDTNDVVKLWFSLPSAVRETHTGREAPQGACGLKQWCPIAMHYSVPGPVLPGSPCIYWTVAARSDGYRWVHLQGLRDLYLNFRSSSRHQARTYTGRESWLCVWTWLSARAALHDIITSYCILGWALRYRVELCPWK